jgi:protein required for attachment to host cells
MRLRVLVADRSDATFFDVDHFHEELQFAGHLDDPEARLHERDLTTDRPGRKFDHGPLQGGRRGATAHHGAGGEPHVHDHEAELFARRIAEALSLAHQQSHFDRLVVIAPPRFLGTLREALPGPLHATIAAEIAKDLVREPPSAVRDHLSATMFRPT